MQISLTGAFKRNFKKLSKQDQERTIQALEMFVTDHKTPILNFEPVISRSGYFTIRSTYSVRVLLLKMTDTGFDVVAVGNHDYIYAAYFKK